MPDLFIGQQLVIRRRGMEGSKKAHQTIEVFVIQGSYAYPGQTPPEICDFDHHFPVLEYPNTGFFGDCSVTGGYRYRGPVASLEGAYIYGDYCSGNIWLAWQTGPNEFEELEFVHNQPLGDLRSFGEDESGNVYVVDGGGIWRFDGNLAPQIASVDPDSGPTTGGTEIVISGTNFLAGATVTIGGETCQGIAVNEPDEISCTTPPGNAGPADVSVENPDGQSDVLPAGFVYLIPEDLIFTDRFEATGTED